MEEIYIDYEQSLIKEVGDFGYEIFEVVGTYGKEDFIITLSSSKYGQNNEAKCEDNNLTENQITNVLKRFNNTNCRRKKIRM